MALRFPSSNLVAGGCLQDDVEEQYRAVPLGQRKIVVGICGLKGHGKDTAALVLQNDHYFERISFADGVKNVVAEILGIPVWWLHDVEKKEGMHEPSGKTYRQWMQLMGTEVGRNIWPAAWTNWWANEVAASPNERIVVTDLRFQNELDIIKGGDWDSLSLRILDPRKLSKHDDMHESERYALMLPVDAEITNDGTIEDLWNRTQGRVLKAFPRMWSA